jgi:hypothetical protein
MMNPPLQGLDRWRRHGVAHATPEAEKLHLSCWKEISVKRVLAYTLIAPPAVQASHNPKRQSAKKLQQNTVKAQKKAAKHDKWAAKKWKKQHGIG